MTMEQAVGLAASRPYEMYASAVARDPTDFVSWSKLLAVVEDGETGERVSEAFEGFLAKFPLCFGYWCKYADMQPRLWSGIGREQVLERTTAIYERAVRAVPLSVELWKSYCAHLKGSTPILDASHIERLRETYERAVLSVGRDAQAAALWDSFLEFEADNGSPETVCRLYRRMVGEDSTGRTDELWRRFKLLCSSFRTSELVSGDEARELLSRYRTAKKLEAVDDPRGSQLAGYTELAEQQQLEQMLAEAEAAKNESIQRRLERQPFEAGVRRWYFHVKPLDEAQLQNWRDYLGREIERAKGVSEKDELERAKTDVQRLFERCLVPCALYAEFWIKYAYWMWRSKGVEAAVTVIERAATIYLPKRVDIMECYALLLEAARRIGDARAVYHAIFDRTVADPAQRASCAVARANFERRQHNRANVLDAYRDTLERAEPGFEAVAAHAARYLVRVAHDLDAARTLLDSAYVLAQHFPSVSDNPQANAVTTGSSLACPSPTRALQVA